MNVLTSYKNRKKDYQSGFDAGVEQGVRESIHYILMAVIQYLGDKRGWKRERIFDAILWLNKHAVMLIEEYTTFPEVADAVKDEYGIVYDDGRFILLPEEEWKHD